MAKLTGNDKKKFLRTKLEEQRGFLRKSIKEFASGDLAEAVRLAMTIRVLVHETGSCTPLLKQLTANYLQLEILDAKPEKEEKLPPGIKKATLMTVPIGIVITDGALFLNSDLALQSRAPSILGKWWTRQSLILPGPGGFSRMEIVLGLANKEGGAHVDINISTKYRQLLASEQLKIGINGQSVTALNLSRYMTAQSAVELLDCLDRNFPPE